MCHGQKSRFFGDGKPPTFNDGILIMGPYKPLWNWVDEFIPLLYGNKGSLDPIAHVNISITKTTTMLAGKTQIKYIPVPSMLILSLPAFSQEKTENT